MTLPLGITALRGYMGSGNASVVMAAVAIMDITLAIANALVNANYLKPVDRRFRPAARMKAEVHPPP